MKKITFGQYVLLAILIVITLLTPLPLLLVISSAFTEESVLSSTGYSFIPRKFSMDGMNAVLRYGRQLFSSYAVSIFITLAGTALGLLIMSMYAYTLTIRDFPLIRFLTVWAIIPMIFTGGLLPTYIIYTTYYRLKDSLLVLILPACVSTMNIIILCTYIRTSIPNDLLDSARIDGAGEYRTFFRIVFPLMKPSMAAVGFMMATAYWNDWQNALLFISKDNLKPLQLLLINIQKSIDALLNIKNIPASVLAAMQGNIPQQSATMATVLVVIGPIILIYPFFQKYFIKGLTIGSVKG